MASELSCLKCGHRMPLDPESPEADLRCGACESEHRYRLFPAFGREIKPGRQADSIVSEGEGSCFFHPKKRAQIPCDLCGRFLCALCDLDLAGRHLCTHCLPTAQKEGALAFLDRERFIPHSAGTLLVVAGLLILPLAILAAPVAIYFAARTLRGETGLTGGGRWQAAVVIVLALGEFAGSSFVVYNAFIAP